MALRPAPALSQVLLGLWDLLLAPGAGSGSAIKSTALEWILATADPVHDRTYPSFFTPVHTSPTPILS